MPLMNDKNNLIIADYDYFPMLFTYRNSHPEMMIKIIEKEEVIDKLGITFKKDPIPFLMKEGIEFNKAKRYVRILRSADNLKNEKLYSLFSKLKNDYIKVDAYGKLELSKYNIFLFEMDEDLEIRSLMDRNDMKYNSLSISEIDSIDFYGKEKNPPIYYFQNKFSQYFYIFSDIKRKIKESPELKNGITIMIKDDFDLFYTDLFSKTFKLPVFGTIKKSFITVPEVKEKLEKIQSSKSFEFDKSELKNENLKNLDALIDKYELRSLDFNFAYINLLEILNANKISYRTSDRGITLTSNFTFYQTPITYVTDFQYDTFYKVSADRNVLNDEELLAVGLNPSYMDTLLDKRKKRNYIFYTNIQMLSRVEQHLNESIYDSQFIEEFNWKNKIEKKSFYLDGLYTTEASKLYHIHQLDKNFYNGKVGDLNSYDHTFTGLNESIVKTDKTWSLTNLEQYINCPFKYYLTTIMPLEVDDMSARWRGTMIHAIMESINHDDFDFETAFQYAREAYMEEVRKSKMEFTAKDEVTLEILKYWLKQVISALHQNYKDNCNFVSHLNDAEQKVEFTLSDGKVNEVFHGSIDKIVWSENNGRKFYTIIDYKTGAERFHADEVFLGKSVQLPLYYYAITTSPNKEELTNGGEFGGFGIQHNYFKTIGSAFKDYNKGLSLKHVYSETKIKGLSLESMPYWQSFDISGLDLKKVNGKPVVDEDGNQELKFKTYGGNLLARRPFTSLDCPEDKLVETTLDHYNFNDILEDAKKAMLKTIKKIRNSEFEIAPTSLELKNFNPDRLSCSYCKYKDICYHKKSDAKDYSDIIKNYFNPKKEEDEDVNI